MMVPAFLDLATPLFIAVRLIAGLGGMFVGYFLSGPLLRIFWRVVFRKPIGSHLLPWAKFASGITLGALLFFFLPLGGGGGWGTGGQGGGGSGTNGGTGDGKGIVVAKGDPAKTKKGDKTPTTTPAREILAIELLGGDRYPGDGKYYLIARKDPPATLSQVDELLKMRPNKLEVHVVFTPISVGKHHNAVDRLRDLAGKYQVPVVEKMDEK